MKKNEIEDFISLELEERSFEEILEDYDLTVAEVFINLYNQGLIDDLTLESRYSSYE